MTPRTPLPVPTRRGYHERMQSGDRATTMDMGMGPPTRVAVR
jgi:hypothetical protein